ncbi:hypothetical protein ACHAXR_007718, partial [Thalassiosira sp. AJA248-18]
RIISYIAFPSIEPNKANQDSYSVTTNFAGRESDALFGVYDGHGEHGDKCSTFVRDSLPSMLAKGLDKADEISVEQMDDNIKQAHKTCHRNMNRSKKVDNDWSGTTAISMYLRGDVPKITVSNVGDSRAVMGSCDTPESSALVATALSRDQTPWRRDERKRIEDKGGRVLTADQLFGKAPIEKDENKVQKWKSKRGLGDGEKVLGDEIDESGQPPRVFSPHGDYPGLSVTRTIGDKVISDEGIGMVPEPEILTRELTAQDKVIFLASDGVWEFMTNQRVIDICAECSDPLEACRIIQKESYDLWMKNDTRTDDITMICMFVDDVSPGGADIASAKVEVGIEKVPGTVNGLSQVEIDGRIESIKETCKATFGGVSTRYAYLSQRGYYPDDPDKANQDSYSVTTNFAGRESDALFGVYDGHGEHGDKCSTFVRDSLPSMLAKGLDKADEISVEQMDDNIKQAHKTCHRNMNRSKKVDNDWSGTTAISMYLRGDVPKITVSNVGDSRAVMGSCDTPESSALVATALSRDQTPWRRDERKRIEDKGGRVLTADQLFGKAPIEKDENKVQKWKSKRGLGDGEKVLGDEIDESGQPPRVFSPHGDYPGLSVTRTIGDKVISDEGIGMVPEPEILTRELTAQDKVIFLASDGVWEFMTNQHVIDICAKCSDPLEACRIIQKESYDHWMKNDTRTDDITMICMFVDGVSSGQ